jgi:hypothetical protein
MKKPRKDRPVALWDWRKSLGGEYVVRKLSVPAVWRFGSWKRTEKMNLLWCQECFLCELIVSIADCSRNNLELARTIVLASQFYRGPIVFSLNIV